MSITHRLNAIEKKLAETDATRLPAGIPVEWHPDGPPPNTTPTAAQRETLAVVGEMDNSVPAEGD